MTPRSDAAAIYGRLAAALDDADFAAYAERNLRILAKDGALVPLRLNHAQLSIHAAIEEQLRETGKVRALVLKGRQQGASTYVEGRYFSKLTRERGQRSFILTHSDPATTRLFGIFKRFYDHLPAPPSLGVANQRELTFDQLGSGIVVSTAGARGAGRSETIQLFHGSEVAFWPNAEEHLGGALQAVPDAPGSEVVLESTSAGPGGLFYEMAQAALRGEGDYRLVFVPWFCQAEYRRAPPAGFVMTSEEEAYAAEHGLDLAQMCWRRAKIIELHGVWNFRREYPATVDEAFRAEAPGALWKRELIDVTRVHAAPRDLMRVVVGVDPSGGGVAECGIVVAALGPDDHVYVLDDLSVRASPGAWAARAVAGYERWQADRIVAEANFGGAMVEHVIRTASENVAVKLVTASRGKQVRAEPAAALYETGRVHHVGAFAALEDELVTWDPARSARSPNRLDALVWAVAELVPAAGGAAAAWLEYYKLLSQGHGNAAILGATDAATITMRALQPGRHEVTTPLGRFVSDNQGYVTVPSLAKVQLEQLQFRQVADRGTLMRAPPPGAENHVAAFDGHVYTPGPGGTLVVEHPHEVQALLRKGWTRA